MPRITSAEVARLAGVSRATVSYVLNEVPGRVITPAVRERVRRVAAEVGYTPSASARALRTGRSSIVLVLVPRLSMGFEFDRELELLDVALAAAGYTVVVHRHTVEARTLHQLFTSIEPAVVVAMGALDRADAVAVDRAGVPLLDITRLISDAEIGRLQVDHLLRAGHRRIGAAVPSEPALAQFAEPRLEGVVAACRAAGLSEAVAVHSDFGPEGSAAALERWSADGVTAICAHNDDIALALLAAAVGDPPAVIGVDDVPLAAFGLSTVRIESTVLAQHIAALVVASVDGTEPPPPPKNVLTVVARRSA